jgi:hypothetical protein
MNQRRRASKRQEDDQYQPRERERSERQGPFDQRTYGNVWTRIWSNQDHQGRVYFTFSQHRLYEQDGVTGVTKSFQGADIEDVIRGAQWAAGTIPKRSTSRRRREQIVREVSDRRR